MKRILLASALVCATIAAAPVANADIIYDNGTYRTDAGNYSDVNYNIGYAEYSSFVLQQDASTVTDIHWWGVYFHNNTPQPADDFTIRIFQDSGSGLPGTLVATYDAGDVGRTDTGVNYWNGSDIYEYSYDINPLTLTAGTTYWLSIYNDTTVDTNDNWSWNGASGPAGGAGAYSAGVNSTTYYLDNTPGFHGSAFTLTNDGVVPEPASILLMGLGLGGVAWRARKKRS